MGNGEFDGIHLQSILNQWGWTYVCRTANNIKIFLDDEEFEIRIIGQFLPPGCYKRVKNVLFTNKKFGPVTVIGWWAEGNEEPIYIEKLFIVQTLFTIFFIDFFFLLD